MVVVEVVVHVSHLKRLEHRHAGEVLMLAGDVKQPVGGVNGAVEIEVADGESRRAYVGDGDVDRSRIARFQVLEDEIFFAAEAAAVTRS